MRRHALLIICLITSLSDSLPISLCVCADHYSAAGLSEVSSYQGEDAPGNH